MDAVEMAATAGIPGK